MQWNFVNHESKERGETFVTRKITQGIASIYHGKKSTIYIGNLNALRDWGHAKDCQDAMDDASTEKT